LPSDLVRHYPNILNVKPSQRNSYIKINLWFDKGFALKLQRFADNLCSVAENLKNFAVNLRYNFYRE